MPTSEEIVDVRKWVEVGKPVADFALRFMLAWGEVGEPFAEFALKVVCAWDEAGKPVADFSSFRLQ